MVERHFDMMDNWRCPACGNSSRPSYSLAHLKICNECDYKWSNDLSVCPHELVDLDEATKKVICRGCGMVFDTKEDWVNKTSKHGKAF